MLSFSFSSNYSRLETVIEMKLVALEFSQRNIITLVRFLLYSLNLNQHNSQVSTASWVMHTKIGYYEKSSSFYPGHATKVIEFVLLILNNGFFIVKPIHLTIIIILSFIFCCTTVVMHAVIDWSV